MTPNITGALLSTNTITNTTSTNQAGHDSTYKKNDVFKCLQIIFEISKQYCTAIGHPERTFDITLTTNTSSTSTINSNNNQQSNKYESVPSGSENSSRKSDTNGTFTKPLKSPTTNTTISNTANSVFTNISDTHTPDVIATTPILNKHTQVHNNNTATSTSTTSAAMTTESKKPKKSVVVVKLVVDDEDDDFLSDFNKTSTTSNNTTSNNNNINNNEIKTLRNIDNDKSTIAESSPQQSQSNTKTNKKEIKNLFESLVVN